MNQEQLSKAIGGVSEALLDEAMHYEGTRVRRKWSRSVVAAACIAAALIVTAAAAGVVSGWRVQTIPADKYEANLPEDFRSEKLLIGDLEIGAYPLAEEVQSRIRAKGYGFSGQPEQFASVRKVEEAYGIRLLRLAPEAAQEERYVYADAGEFDPATRPEGGIMVSGSWVTQNAGWGANTHFQLCTTSIDAGGVGGVSYGVRQTEQLSSYDIKALGVPAQIVVAHMGQPVDAGENQTPDLEAPPEVVAFFAKDDIAYSIVFYVPTQENLLTAEDPISDISISRFPTESGLVDWVCAKLETLSY